MDFERIKLLFEYTKFHIRVYATVATIFGGLVASGGQVLKFSDVWLWSIVFICFAGFARGVVASSIPHYQNFNTFWVWTYAEHI